MNTTVSSESNKTFAVKKTDKGNYMIMEVIEANLPEKDVKLFGSIEEAETHIESLNPPKKYVPTIAIRRNIRLTKENSDKVHMSLVRLEFILQAADFIYNQFPDVDLKSPVIHRKLKTAYEFIGDARKYIGKMIFIEDEGLADETLGLFCNITDNIMLLDGTQMVDLNDNLESIIDLDNKMKAAKSA